MARRFHLSAPPDPASSIIGCFNAAVSIRNECVLVVRISMSRASASVTSLSPFFMVSERVSLADQSGRLLAVAVGENNTLATVGITCALYHSTVDNSVAPGIGSRLDGWANRTLNVGAIIALSRWRDPDGRTRQLQRSPDRDQHYATPDLVTSKLPALLKYQLSLAHPRLRKEVSSRRQRNAVRSCSTAPPDAQPATGLRC
jgi:hypothetical protein